MNEPNHHITLKQTQQNQQSNDDRQPLPRYRYTILGTLHSEQVQAMNDELLDMQPVTLDAEMRSEMGQAGLLIHDMQCQPMKMLSWQSSWEPRINGLQQMI